MTSGAGAAADETGNADNADTLPARSCLIANDTGFYGAGEAMPARICLGADETADLTLGHTEVAGHYPVNRVEVAPGHELIASDAPEFGGRLWRLRRSLQGAKLRALGIRRHALASATVVATACLHEHDQFVGKPLCLGAGPLHKRLARLDSSVSSIRVPPGYSVAAFRRVNGTGRSAVFRADVDAETLRREGLHDAIRAVQVLRMKPACTQRCAVAGSDAWDLDAMRGNGLGDTPLDDTPWQARVTFDLARGRSFGVDYGGMLRLDVRNGRMIVSTGRPRQDEWRRFDARSRFLTIQISVTPAGSDLVAQIIEADAHDTAIATNFVQVPRASPAHALLSVRNTAKGTLALAPFIHRFEWTLPATVQPTAPEPSLPDAGGS